MNHNYVGTEHQLLGLLREQDGVAAQVLMNLGLKLEEVREEVLGLLGASMEDGEDIDADELEEGDEGEAAGGPHGSPTCWQEPHPGLGQLWPRSHRSGQEK